MPCACRLPLETYPAATEWGPILWRILHGLAERATTTPFKMFQADETRLYIALIKQTALILPCDTCSQHYKLYLQENPPDPLKTMDYLSTRDWIRRWFWILHNEVNAGFTPPRPAFPWADLPATYQGVSLRAALKELERPIQRAIQINGTRYADWLEWKKTVTKLLANLGV
jgi:hypothetical protein